MSDILGAIRRKYRSYVPKSRAVLDEDGVVISDHVDGVELLDDTKIDPPVGFSAEPSMMEIVRKMVEGEMARRAIAEQGLETIDDFEDFDVGDDDERLPFTRHEIEAMDEFVEQKAQLIRDAKKPKKEASKEPPERSNSEAAPGAPQPGGEPEQ